jgi:hypothetical protein
MKRKSTCTNPISYKSKEIHTLKEREEKERKKEKKVFLKTLISYTERKNIDLFCSAI